MTFETIEIERSAIGAATLWLNRPEVHNAFNEQVIADIHNAVRELEGDDSVRVMLLRGRGKSFSAGADLNWMKKAAQFSQEENQIDAMNLSNMLNALDSMAKPVIALVHGAAMGGGLGLAACADIVIATTNAKFALSEVRLGILPATISPFVYASMGERMMRRYALTGERFTGEQALRMGFVHETVENEDQLDTTAQGVIDALLQGGPFAISATKKLIHSLRGKEVDEELRKNTAERIAVRRTSPEGQEGLAAFLEKRAPQWTGDKK